MTLEQLAVVSAPQITFDSPTSPPDHHGRRRVTVEFTPTVPHCGMSTFIGELISPLHQKEAKTSSIVLLPFRSGSAAYFICPSLFFLYLLPTPVSLHSHDIRLLPSVIRDDTSK